MRIIRGKHRGRRIIAPGNLPVRPTTDLAKESLFNILGNNFDFEECRVLDLFAGIGGISFEFASRECMMVIAVDNHPGCIRFISDTAARLGFTNLSAVKAPVSFFIKSSHQQFDIIFADPPYEMDGTEDIPTLIFEKELLAKEGWLIIEHPGSVSFTGHPRCFDTRKYGKVHFSFFR